MLVFYSEKYDQLILFELFISTRDMHNLYKWDSIIPELPTPANMNYNWIDEGLVLIGNL